MAEQPLLLIVDDDTSFLRSISKLLRLSGYNSITLDNPNEVLLTISEYKFSAILLDIQMPGITGLQLTEMIQQKHPSIPIIIVSGNGTINIAVEAIKLGAYDYIEKPVEHDQLMVVLEKALRDQENYFEKEYLKKEIEEGIQLIGNSDEINKIKNEILLIGQSKVRVLITGESGTGKELVAAGIHYNSPRKGKAFIKLNCASLPANLLESELFGYKKGAFTGANQDKPGKFQAADKGTLFLDEIAEMDPVLQAKLLRVLEEGEVDVLGDNNVHKVDVRIITATNKDLKEQVEKGLFREDLFHRLNVAKIHIPPLRERKSDIIPIAYFFIEKFKNEYNKDIQKFSAQAEGILKNHEWAGNVRELKNFIENVVIFTNNNVVEVNDIMYSFKRFGQELDQKKIDSQVVVDLKSAKLNFEREYIKMVLDMNDWNVSSTAEGLQIDRVGLHKKITAYNLKKD